MIYGIGIDIVKIDRIKGIVEKWGAKFLEKVFTENELSYCFEKKNPHPSLAVRFAAKEALMKAIGSEIPVALIDIEVALTDKGKPVLKIGSKLRDFFNTKQIRVAHISLSHEHDYGVACVVLERE